MVNPAQPGLEVREHEMNDRHELFGNLRIAAFGDGHRVKAVLGETGVAAPIVRDDLAPGATTVFTKPPSARALRSGTTASLTRPA